MQLNISSPYTDMISNKEALVKIVEALYILVNEVRVLKGQSPLTKKQYIIWLKGL